MNILALTDKISSASTRIRIIQMSDYLEKYGVKLKIVEIPDSFFCLMKVLKRENYDLIWWQKKMLNPLRSVPLNFFRRSIVFDFDDNLLVRMKPKNGFYESKGREIRFAFYRKVSRGFTCGNAFLATLIEGSGKSYVIYPTPVPINVPHKDCSTLNSPLVVGWVGLSAGFIYLDKMVSQLAELRKELEFKLVVISENDYSPGYDFVENIRWSLETQEKEISKFDIGIMPLNTESPYDRGKCSYKLLQYMASGVVAVGEAYGTNLDVIKDGLNGFLVYNNDWYGTLKRIIEGIKNKNIDYCRISKEAIKTVVEEYSYEALAPKLASFFGSIAYEKG